MLEMHTQLNFPILHIVFILNIQWWTPNMWRKHNSKLGFGVYINPRILKVLPSSLQECWRCTHSLIRHFAYCIHTEYPVVNAKNMKKASLENRVWGLQTLESLKSRRAVYRHVGDAHTAWFAFLNIIFFSYWISSGERQICQNSTTRN